jgi:ABC-type nitrate/sulfonate/bicarbonate transport system permease component
MKEADKTSSVVFNILNYLLPVIGFLLIWEIAGLYSAVLPTPVETAQKIGYMFSNKVADKVLFQHIGRSLFRMLSGLVIGVGIGVPLGILMGYNNYFEAFTKYLFEAFRMIPALAWIPLSIMFFGISEFGKIFIIVIASIVPSVINSWRGVKLVDPDKIMAAKILGADNKTILRRVILPSSLPSIYAGVQYAVSISWMCILAAELVGAGEGIGYLILYGMEIPDDAMMAAGMVIIGIIGFALSQTLRSLEGVLTPWK